MQKTSVASVDPFRLLHDIMACVVPPWRAIFVLLLLPASASVFHSDRTSLIRGEARLSRDKRCSVGMLAPIVA
jgi:hypothetical protein